jgi:hypothetical protein
MRTIATRGDARSPFMRDTLRRVWHLDLASGVDRCECLWTDAERMGIRLGAYCAVEISERKWAGPALTDAYLRGVLFEKKWLFRRICGRTRRVSDAGSGYRARPA